MSIAASGPKLAPSTFMSVKKSSPLVAGILLIGVVARVATAVGPGSLWFDELATALNAADRGWSQLLDPLGYRQVAPFGFIAAEAAAVALFGYTEISLRLVPLLASVACLFLFWRVALRFLSGTAFYGALGMFALSPALVWYARRVKQYSTDLFAALVLLLLALSFVERPPSPRRAAIAGLLGAGAIILSQPAALVAAGILAVLLFQVVRARGPRLPFVILSAFWILGVVAQAVTSQRLTPPETMAFMSNAWNFAFFPSSWSSPASFLWLPRQLFHFTGFVVGLMSPDTALEAAFLGVYFVLAALGVGYLARRASPSIVLLFTPLAVAVLASVFRILPLSGRLMIYVAPTLVVACFAGIEWLGGRLSRRIVQPLAIGMVVVQAAFLLLLIPTLNRREDAGTVLRELDARWQPGDILYAHVGAAPAMQFYGLPLGLEPWIEGRSDRDGRAILRELDALRGRPRAWVFLTNNVRCRAPQIRSYLETIGTEVDVIEDPHGVTGMHEALAHLYDLSDPDRLSRSSAETHPLIERGDPRCRSGSNSAGEVLRHRLWNQLDPTTGGSPAFP